jgi:class 3 adenylate cyclase
VTPEHPVVLIVDDDELNRTLLKSTLEVDGFDTKVAADGRVALDLLLRDAFDLILCDLVMPHVGGLELLSHVKGDANLRSTPVVMISSSDEEDTAVRCIELGADDYLTKPVRPALLRARVRSSLARKQLIDLQTQHTQLLRDLFGRHVGDAVARDALAHAGSRRTGELRDASLLFVDVIGSTALAQRLPPHEVVGALNNFFETVVAVTSDHGGWVNKFEGDAALCVFGAPVDQADHATRALQAARALRIELDQASKIAGLEAAIGVSSGQVVAGYVGAANRYEYTVIGDPVNEAARLTEAAKQWPRRVLASAASLQAAARDEQGNWSVEASLELRGRSRPTLSFAPIVADAQP